MRILINQIVRCLALVLAAGLASAALARYAPGALVDDRELDQRFSQETITALREARAANANLIVDWYRFVSGILKGDLGYSASKNVPIADLIRQGAPPTISAIGIGLAGSWSISLLFGILLSGPGRKSGENFGVTIIPDLTASLLLSMPAALIAYLCLNAGADVPTILTVVLAPRLFRFSRNLLKQAYGANYIVMARARGVREWQIVWRHVLPAARPQLLALGASSLSMAVGAAIPVEAILDSAGLGRLAWEAAMARDIPLLVNLTMLIALSTTAAAGLAEAIAGEFSSARKTEATC